MKFVFTRHAQERAQQRGISFAQAKKVVLECIMEGRVTNSVGQDGRKVLVAQQKVDGSAYPLRVVFNAKGDNPANLTFVMVTVLWKGKPD